MLAGNPTRENAAAEKSPKDWFRTLAELRKAANDATTPPVERARASRKSLNLLDNARFGDSKVAAAVRSDTQLAAAVAAEADRAAAAALGPRDNWIRRALAPTWAKRADEPATALERHLGHVTAETLLDGRVALCVAEKRRSVLCATDASQLRPLIEAAAPKRRPPSSVSPDGRAKRSRANGAPVNNKTHDFCTARQQLAQDQQTNPRRPPPANTRRLGTTSATAAPSTANGRRFVSPLTRETAKGDADAQALEKQANLYNVSGRPGPKKPAQDAPPADERLRNIEPRMVEMIQNEIMDSTPSIGWDDIAGLDHAKATIKESVIWPMLRPDIFTGLRGPPKGILLYGPPGTGKTLIGKCIASSSGATFFSISSSSLTSKYVGDGEKMVRALFAVARVHQPAVIFVDEIDSLLTQRTDGEFDATRRIKTEFLVQFDGCGTCADDRILLIGATNRPRELDEAARRRFRKKLYIPLPDAGARRHIVARLLHSQPHTLSDADLDALCARTDGYSGSDMDNLCREAALGPIRSIGDIRSVAAADVRGICLGDFDEALTQVRASVSPKDLEWYLEFDREHGSVSSSSCTGLK